MLVLHQCWADQMKHYDQMGAACRCIDDFLVNVRRCIVCGMHMEYSGYFVANMVVAGSSIMEQTDINTWWWDNQVLYNSGQLGLYVLPATIEINCAEHKLCARVTFWACCPRYKDDGF